MKAKLILSNIVASTLFFTGCFTDSIVSVQNPTSSEKLESKPNTHSLQYFNGNWSEWHSWFAPNNELPLTGDFNNDGKQDVITFTQGSGADVYVSLSNGQRFVGNSWKWHNYFAPGDEIPLVGDFNGDGKDDIVTFTNDHAGDVWVALSNGPSFQSSRKWNGWFAPNNEIPKVGDFNGDGLDDIITFTNNSNKDIYIAYSNGSVFGNVKKINLADYSGNDIPFVGDFNGDGKTDILIGEPIPASGLKFKIHHSNGFAFNAPNNIFSQAINMSNFEPQIADMNGDNKDDFVFINHNQNVVVHEGNDYNISHGNNYGILYRQPGVYLFTDVNGDKNADLIHFTNDNRGKVYVKINQ